METVRLRDGEECLTVEKNEIAALLEALCERPLEDGQAEPSAELQALRREASRLLSQSGDATAGPGGQPAGDADRLTAALATLLSGANVEAARQTLADAAARSASVRLDAEAALAFIDTIEQSAESAPAHLVEELLLADKLAPTRADRVKPGFWQRVLGGVRPARRWRVVGACAVVLIAAGASWSFYWQQSGFVSEPPAPMAKSTIEQPAAADAPAPPRPAIAAEKSCETRKKASARAADQAGKPERQAKANADAASECDDNPDHQLADQPAGETTKQAAQQQEAARQAAAARSAAEAASKAGASQAGESAPNPVEADRAGRLLGSREYNRPAATMSAPPAAPAARPAAPAR
jgi:hypothetical protein